MKRATSDNEPPSTLQKMAPGASKDTESRSSGNSLDRASQLSYTRDDDYSSFMSDVMVVGAGPAGLMLA
jgi:phenol 2-monooxygenase